MRPKLMRTGFAAGTVVEVLVPEVVLVELVLEVVVLVGGVVVVVLLVLVEVVVVVPPPPVGVAETETILVRLPPTKERSRNPSVTVTGRVTVRKGSAVVVVTRSKKTVPSICREWATEEYW